MQPLVVDSRIDLAIEPQIRAVAIRIEVTGRKRVVVGIVVPRI